MSIAYTHFFTPFYRFHKSFVYKSKLIEFNLFYYFQQIEAADKQLKATRQFLEDQAAEREQERDEFSKEIEKLRQIVKEKDKDKSSQDSCQKEVKNIYFSYDSVPLCRSFKILILHNLFSRTNY